LLGDDVLGGGYPEELRSAEKTELRESLEMAVEDD
jgi:hypothetical protein